MRGGDGRQAGSGLLNEWAQRAIPIPRGMADGASTRASWFGLVWSLSAAASLGDATNSDNVDGITCARGGLCCDPIENHASPDAVRLQACQLVSGVCLTQHYLLPLRHSVCSRLAQRELSVTFVRHMSWALLALQRGVACGRDHCRRSLARSAGTPLPPATRRPRGSDKPALPSPAIHPIPTARRVRV